MRRPPDPRVLLAAVALWGVACAGPASTGMGGRAPGNTPPPDIVLIVADDLGWRDLGVQGSRFFDTPRLDALAAEGMRFTQGYANGPNCAPSRAALLSGRLAPRHGIYSVAPNARGRAQDRRLVPAPDATILDTSFVTMAEMLRSAGYRTGFFGKWHLGADGFLPTDQGFEVAVGGDHLGAPPTHFAPYERGPRSLRDLGGTGAPGEYLADRLTDEAIRFLERPDGRPTFLLLSHYAVHTPIEIDSARAAPFEGRPADGAQSDARYAGMVTAVDQSVGRILDLLQETGRAVNTVVVFVSDNGGVQRFTDARPLRGGKGMLYEGGIRVPWLVRWPGHVDAGATTDVPVAGSDLMATFADMAGAPEPATDGVSIVPVLEGHALAPRDLFWHFPAYLEGPPGHWRTTPASVIRTGRWKLVHFFEDDRDELYDLEEDPGEAVDRGQDLPDLVLQLRKRLEAWWTATGAFLPVDPNPDYEPGP